MKSNIKRCFCFGALMLTALAGIPTTALAGTNTAMALQQQNGKVKGNVSDADGGVIGATVMQKGTNNGTVTDMDGNFSINAKKGDVLVISYVGYSSQEVKVGDGPINVKLTDDNTQLSEVVVTALGVKRDRKALGYGVSEIKGEDLIKAKETNVINSLSGKVAGLVVQQTAGGASGSTRVQLRGATELSGNNQPLYVIDGVPLDNTNFHSVGQAGGYDLGDGISAINPDDIENMTVLKGPAAAALYGSRASHGVIMITTKKANTNEKWSVEYNGSITADTQSSSWDNVQTKYGMGFAGGYNAEASSGTNSSWGPIADNFTVNYSYAPDGQKEKLFYMYPNNTSNFFRTGVTATNTAIVSVSTGKTGVRFSATDMRNKDILPTSHMSRDNFNLRVNTSLGKVDLDFTANYTREDVKNRPALGDSKSNVGKNLMTLAGTFNQEWLKYYQNERGEYVPWTGRSEYDKNPYWDLYKNENTSAKDIFRFTAKAVYNINDHLKIQGTVATDINNMEFSDFAARTTPGQGAGQMTLQTFNNRTINAEILALYNNSWGDFDFNATLGGNIFNVNNKNYTLFGQEQQMDDIKNIMNYSEQSITPGTYKKQINSIFASAGVGYKHTYYLDATLRGDKSSTLPAGNNVYVYPSVSASVVWSEYLKNKNIINYGKFRLSWAKVGSDTEPFQLGLNYGNAQYSYTGYNIGMINNVTKPNANLRPTMTNSFELGLETKMFRNRMSIDFTYYNQNSKDQIVSLATSSASGYQYSLVNAGNIRNSGIELAINGRVLQYKDFGWDMGFNFSKNWNKVTSLVEGMDYFEREKATWSGVSVGAMVGENYGCIRGRDFQRTDDGKIIVDATGMPKLSDEIKTLGNASWDWTGGFYTTFTYKGFRLSAGFDVKVGADIYSMSMRSALLTGRSIETLEGRDEWYASEEARKAANMTPEQWQLSGNARGYIVNGVIENADGTYKPNNIAVDPEAYWKSVSDNCPSLFIYDNSYVKCRELTFGYDFPKKWLGNKVKSLSVSFVARNPFIIWKNIPNIDPDSGYNTSGLGLEYGSLPSRRSYGLNVNLKF
ncbi:MAG: SusC/RagA family TonB-linked outer membrane protein [Prevotella sp.]|nr:SusC/RagA family TonB-linked outer membrane protein [Candidatus Prevotella equi]